MIYIYYAKKLENAHDYLNKLNKDVQKKILDNKNDNKQKQMITAELLLKYAFKNLNLNQDLKIIYTPKPVVEDNDIYISKSHSDNLVVVGVSNNEIGIDIEKTTDSIAAKKILSNNEYNNYLTDKNKMFSFYWSIKEAYIKNIGFLSKDYNKIEVNVKIPIKNINIGKVLNKHYYHTFIDEYSFSVVSDNKKEVKMIEVGEQEL